VYNSRGVDELVFIDIFASAQNRKLNLKLAAEVIKECYMPVAIGGGISNIDDINALLKIGADKVVIKSKAITDQAFIKAAVHFFGSQCISIAVDAKRDQDTGAYMIYNTLGKVISLPTFIAEMEACEVGEYVVTSVDCDGMMSGFDRTLIHEVSELTKRPIIAVGGGGNMNHYRDLFSETNVEAVGSASIFHFTQFTPLDIKTELAALGKPVRVIS
jgi:cyclase